MPHNHPVSYDLYSPKSSGISSPVYDILPTAKSQPQRALLDAYSPDPIDMMDCTDKDCSKPAIIVERREGRTPSESSPRVWCESRACIPTTTHAEIYLHVYKNDFDNKEHLAIVFGEHLHSRSLFAVRENETEHDRMIRGAYSGKLNPERTDSGEFVEKPNLEDEGVLCRVHSECYTGETAWSARCDCGEQLNEAARLMTLEGTGIIVYLRQEGRGIGLGEKLKAYNLQDLGADTVQANLMLQHPVDGRSYGIATAILSDLGVRNVRLLTNNPDKIAAIEGDQKLIKVISRVPMVPLFWQGRDGIDSQEIKKYLETKVERMGHLLDIDHSKHTV